jgi:hypothetical protein
VAAPSSWSHPDKQLRLVACWTDLEVFGLLQSLDRFGLDMSLSQDHKSNQAKVVEKTEGVSAAKVVFRELLCTVVRDTG